MSSQLPHRPAAKFPDGTVVEIRELRAQGNSLKLLAEKFAVSVGCISRIARGETYGDVGGPIIRAESVNVTRCKRGHVRAGNEYRNRRTGKRKCLVCAREMRAKKLSPVVSPYIQGYLRGVDAGYRSGYRQALIDQLSNSG